MVWKGLKKYLFGTVKLTRNATKSKLIYSGQEIGFDDASKSNYGNNFTRNVKNFYVDNSLMLMTTKIIIFYNNNNLCW